MEANGDAFSKANHLMFPSENTTSTLDNDHILSEEPENEKTFSQTVGDYLGQSLAGLAPLCCF